MQSHGYVRDRGRVAIRRYPRAPADSERRRSSEELALRARLRDAVDAAMIATDPAGVVTHWNSAYTAAPFIGDDGAGGTVVVVGRDINRQKAGERPPA